ncbi:MAG: Tad domain-containing protein [Gammaproteobacteria bacterium]|nr:Tad domain-containing protein [Gammaproteobacteria bacterium]
MDKHRLRKYSFTAPPKRQEGVIVVIVALGAVALLGAAGLAFDVGHIILSKTRLQNSVDAAALSGAKEIIVSSGDITLATAAARNTFFRNAEASGNHDMLEYYNGGGAVDVEFSATLYPFAPGTTPPEFVRVRVATMPLDTWIVSAIGITEKSVAATAVAGPSPPLGPESDACNLAPMMVCGDPASPEGTHFGYALHDVQVLKTSSTHGNFEVGPGNFQLIRLDDGQGGADVRDAMAGTYGGCLSASEDIETEPGNTIGPVAQGFNTRFGQYSGAMNSLPDPEGLYPPDVITTENTVDIQFDAEGHVTTQVGELDFNHTMYTAASAGGPYDYAPAPAGLGHFERRVLAVPVGDCTETTSGHGFVPLLGYACFFMLQKVSQQGNDAHIYGQFIENCRAYGTPGPQPGGGGGATGVGPIVIQLYEDPDSTDS